MKKVLWMAVIAAVAFSCKDDDEKNVNIAGTWVIVSDVWSGCDDPDENETNLDENGCEDQTCTTITFDDGTFYFSDVVDGDEVFSLELEYTVKGSTVTVEGQKVTAKRNGDTLTLTTKDEDSGCTNTTTLKLAD